MGEAKRLQELIIEMREGEHEVMLAAVEELRSRGWLTDGSLRRAALVKANLREANLREADLGKADLSGADLSEANLRSAIMIDANLNVAMRRNRDFKVVQIGTSLQNADLHKAYLSEADLGEADLSGADLSGADLRRANLREADLGRSNLSRADLGGADLGEADLSGADLSGADLSRANLFKANLVGAILYGVQCAGTVFSDVNLAETAGLESIVHRGPSYVDIPTLYNSKGNIPERFLRGCGVPEDFIQYMLPLVRGSAIEFYSCFISYNHTDKSFARRVHDTLQGRGIRCWLDEKQLKPGHHIYDEVDRGIRLWDKVLLCCSEQSLNSWWVENEIAKAFKKEQDLWKTRSKKIRVLIPLDLDGYLFSDSYQSGLKDQIHTRLAADFKGWETDNDRFEQQFERVVKALRTDEGREIPPESKLWGVVS